MEVKILDSFFKLKGVLDAPRRLSFSECFQDAGSLLMEVDFDKKLYQLLKPPSRVLVNDLIFNVERLVCADGVIRVYGSGIFSEFKQFYISMPEEHNGSPADILYAIAAKASFEGINYGVYGIAVEDTRVSESYEWCIDLYGVITQLCFDYDLGFRLTYSFDTSELRFNILNVRDRATNDADTLTIISDRFDSYTDIEATLDLSNYKNTVELIYRVNALDELVSYTYSNRDESESVRGYIEFPHLIPQTETELYKSFYSYAKKVFKERRKKHCYKVRTLADSMYAIGDLCYFESEALGDRYYALITERKVELSDTVCTEVLTLEVQN